MWSVVAAPVLLLALADIGDAAVLTRNEAFVDSHDSDWALLDFNFSASVERDTADMTALVQKLSADSQLETEDLEHLSSEDTLEPLLLQWGGWSQGGDKMWGSGSGMEAITSDNIAYYNKGMKEAQAHCGGPNCALITNPSGHRSINHFHIHFVHYHSYGANLKKRLEAKVCGNPGWHKGFPCHGRAAFFPGFPGIFSKAAAGGSINHASVIAWPMSCDGKGTIIEVAPHCSIEHQIRGDYRKNHR